MKKQISNIFILVIVFSLALTVGCKKDKKDITPELGPTSVTDIDGNVYKVVKIGTQYWMAENLRVTHFRNGDPIPTTNPPELNIYGVSYPKYQWVTGYNDSLLKDYGRVYTFYAAIDMRGLAPAGWHIPTKEECITLFEHLGGDKGVTHGLYIGGKLKEEGTTHWDYPNFEATNEVGWNAYGGGVRDYDGNFNLIKKNGYWLTTTEYTSLFLRNVDGNYGFQGGPKNYAHHVRCIKD